MASSVVACEHAACQGVGPTRQSAAPGGTDRLSVLSPFLVPRLPVFQGEFRLGREVLGHQQRGHEQSFVALLDQLLAQHVSLAPRAHELTSMKLNNIHFLY